MKHIPSEGICLKKIEKKLLVQSIKSQYKILNKAKTSPKPQDCKYRSGGGNIHKTKVALKSIASCHQTCISVSKNFAFTRKMYI